MRFTPKPDRAILAATLVALAAPAWPANAQAVFNVGGDTFAAPVTSLRDMPFRTVVRQQYDYSCGSAALATLLRHHYGREVSEAAVFKAMYLAGDQEKIRRVGFSLLDMKNYLASVGLRADGYRQTLEDLGQAKAPAIALITVKNYRHFVVIKGVRDGKVLVGDPNEGLRLYSMEDFGRAWNGVVFVVRPDGGDRMAFNREEEWGSLAQGPFNRLDDRSLSSVTRALPPIYQIATSGMIVGHGQ
jgi:predicted double-glycine peptidase